MTVVPSNYTAFIEKLEKMASEQKICLTGIVSEAEEGQFELNSDTPTMSLISA